ncbi:hydrogen gas-evolving membrane-bound hydrogenase subunit E [Rubellimicrobium roseum]|uniref:DUF4040 domain-containing protein n=1 Tax=Rubellimicrobium roseum TaxID=687525 RepID=A0A5C4NAP3_9RHOB|nr:hydrogen gas-evolving membrane-bound hydrogenase subunit E [Rubellimicrobium roseum]TNC65804.1 DUF4040 domain-containing protein [Rubellimicrobium roseum]
MSGLLISALDLVLGLLTLGLAAATLGTRDQARMLMLFVTFGGVVALLWVRLRAPDVALAEASIGAALTGGLLLRMRPMLPPSDGNAPRPIRALAAALALGTFAALAWALSLVDWGARPSLAGPVFERLPESGVTNPVTAVLLNFRAYDTLLEVAVLLVAVVGVWMLSPRAPALTPLRDDPLFLALLRLLVPFLCILAGYLLWLGSFAPGGAFQAGAALSAAFLFLLLAGVPDAPGQADRAWLRAALVMGLAVFIAVAVGVSLRGAALLEYPPAQAKNLILLIEAALTVSIALTLMVLFQGGRPASRDGADP